MYVTQIACHVRCKVKYSRKYSSDSKRCNEESSGIQYYFMYLAPLFVSLLWIAVDHEHNRYDILSQENMFQRAIRQSTAESFSVDNLRNVVH